MDDFAIRPGEGAVVKRQRGLQLLLAAGTVFAWGNFAYEVYRFMQPQPATSAFSCPAGEAAVNPLMIPCFYGALIFLVTLVVSILITRIRVLSDRLIGDISTVVQS